MNHLKTPENRSPLSEEARQIAWMFMHASIDERESMRALVAAFAELLDAGARDEEGRAQGDEIEQATAREAAVHLRAAARCLGLIAEAEKKHPLDSCQAAEGEHAGAPAKKPYTPPTLRHLGSVRNITGAGASTDAGRRKPHG